MTEPATPTEYQVPTTRYRLLRRQLVIACLLSTLGLLLATFVLRPSSFIALRSLLAPSSQILCVDDSGGATASPCANPTAFTRIQDAVNNASTGDEIRIAAGTYVTGTGTTVVNIDKAVSLTGGFPGAADWTTLGDENQTVIDGQGVREGITVGTNSITVVAQNLTVINGGIVMNQCSCTTLNNDMPVRTRTLNHVIGTIGGSAPITVTNAFTWTGGIETGAGHTDLLAGGQLNISGAIIASAGRVINNFGIANWSGNSSGITLNSAALNNQAGAVFTITGSNQGVGDNGSAFNNFGTIIKTSAGDTNLLTFFSNSGQVQIHNGRLVFGLGSSTGTFDVSPGAVLDVCNCFTHIFQPSSAIIGAGTLQIEGGPAIISGTFTLPVVNVVGGTVNFDSVGANTASTINVLTDTAALGGTRVLTITNRFDWLGGALSGSGRVDVPAGAQLNTTGGNMDGGRVVNNFGTATWSGTNSAIAMSGGSVFNNQVGAVFTIVGSNQGIGSSGAFNNFGTITKTNLGDLFIGAPSLTLGWCKCKPEGYSSATAAASAHST